MTRYLLPLAVFVAIALFLGAGLRLDPRELPSALIGKPAPAFELPRLVGAGQVRPADYRDQVWLLNVWATWCAACRAEHEVLNRLAHRLPAGVAGIVGLNYNDDNQAARAWLVRLGDPYIATAVDAKGGAAIDWGVYGAPETFVIDAGGVVRHKHVGPLTAEVVSGTLLPLLRRLVDSSG